MKKIIFRYTSTFCVLVILLVIACNTDSKPEKREVPEENKPNISVKLERFDQDLFNYRLNPDSITLKEINKKYPGFFYLFTKNVLNIGDSTNPQFSKLLLDFLQDPEINRIKDEVASKIPDLTQTETELNLGFIHYNYFFPNKKIPKVVTVISGFNYQNIATENTLAIGLEFYLGSNHRYYKMLQYPEYKISLLNKEYIAADALKNWIFTEFEDNADKKDLLSQMIFHGKIIYLLDQLMPDVDDTLKTGFSANQLAWMKMEETKIWKFFIDKKLLFNNKAIETMKYINEGPFTPGMPREAPARVAVWVGWQIVNAYMKKHTEISPAQLMKNKDAARILSQSGYKPI